MNLQEIKQAIKEGKRVKWASGLYDVILDKVGQYLIVCSSNEYTIGLTHRDEITLNGREDQFYFEDYEARDALDKEFKDNFMKPEIGFSDYVEYESKHNGTNILPAGRCHLELVDDLIKHVETETGEEDIIEAEIKTGFIGRLSASGYTDATEWTTGTTIKELADTLIEMYADDN